MDSTARSGPRVLIVDDDALSREVLGLVAQDLGCEVAMAEGGEQALALLRTARPEQLPAVILVDVQMPGLAGNALAGCLRSLVPSGTRLFAISATQPPADEIAAFDELLLKPLSVGTLERILLPARAADAAAQTTAAKATPAPEQAPPALNEVTYRSIASAMTRPQLDELYNMCLTDAERRIGQMHTASVAGDREGFIRLAHAIKGGCGMVGATELAFMASGFEDQGPPAVDDIVPFQRFLAASRRLRRILDAQSG